MPDPIPKILKIVLVVIVLLVLLFWHMNSSYVADVGACRIENSECSESEASAAKASYDSMDGLYYIHSLYTDSGEIKLKDFCLARETEKYSATCEDEKGNSWNITLLELRGGDSSDYITTEVLPLTDEELEKMEEEQAHILEVERILLAETKDADEVQSTYIKDVYQKDGEVYIDADYFVTLGGKEAVLRCFNIEIRGCLWSPELKAKKNELMAKVNSFSNDNSTFEDQYYKLSSEYEIGHFNNGVWMDVNDNPQIRTFKLSPDAKIRLMKETGSSPDLNALSPEELMNKKDEVGYISYPNDEHKENSYFVPFQLFLKNGEVIAMHQIYRP